MSWDFDKLQEFQEAGLVALKEQMNYMSLVRAEILQTLRLGGLRIGHESVHFWFCEGFWVDPKSSAYLVATDTRNFWNRYDIYASTMSRYPDLGIMALRRDHSDIAIYRLEREVTDRSKVVVGSRYQP
jgi:hypothetical protein